MNVSVKANAKINLLLDITGKREDGYHYIDTVMQSVDLHDVVTVWDDEGEDILLVQCEGNEMPLDETNIAYKAAKAFFDYTKKKNKGICIKIKKNIPIAAGLAGGSADGAAVIKALDILFDTKLTQQQMCEIGEKIGADIPFCLTGGTMHVTGIGEELKKLCDMPDCFFVVVKPVIGVSTAEAYKKTDETEFEERPNSSRMCSALEDKNLVWIADCLGNVFEQALELEEVKQIREIMEKNWALGSAMSGSGSAVFGIFEDKFYANECCNELKKQYNEVYLCHPAKAGVEV